MFFRRTELSKSHMKLYIQAFRQTAGAAGRPGMTTEKKETISLEEATKAVEATARRIALLHLSYARTLVAELGETEGTRLIAKAIRDYGIRIGERTKRDVQEKGLEPLPENFNAAETYAIPRFGMSEWTEKVQVDNEARTRVHGCVLAKVWHEYGDEKLGRLYCHVDPAKYMAYNAYYKQIHTRAVPDGDDYCEMAIRPTSENERRIFSSKSEDWFSIDK